MDQALYNSRNMKVFLDYLRLNQPTINVDKILDRAGMTIYQVEDTGHWFTQEQIDHFYEAALEESGIEDLARHAGRFAAFSQAAMDVQSYALSFLTPTTAYTMMAKIYETASHACKVTTKRMTDNQVEISVVPKEGVKEKQYQCENRTGILEALGKIFTNRFPKIEHPECFHRGGKACRYVISWEPLKSLSIGKYRTYFVLLWFIALAVGAFFSSALVWGIGVITGLLILLTLTLVKMGEEKKELIRLLKQEGESADRLLKQINLRYNNLLMLREVGQVTSSIVDPDSFIHGVMEVIEKRLDFGRGLIMLADQKRTMLSYVAGYGYSGDQEKVFKGASFHLDEAGSTGPFVQCFHNQDPVLIDNLDSIEDKVTKRSYMLARVLEVRSFICVPIVYEGRSEGILAVDSLRSQRPLNQSDISILMGIAPQIAMGLNNARAYRLVQEQKEKFRALSDNSPDIIYTIGFKGEITHLNPAWERVLGYPVQGMLGRPFVDFVKPNERNHIREAFEDVRKKGNTISDLVCTLIHRDGTERLFTMSGAPNLDSEENVTGVVGICKDITDLKRSEAELQRSLLKLKMAVNGTVDTISTIVESRDPYTAGHQRRVADLACAIAEEMHLPAGQIDAIRMGCLLHDIGKIQVPAEILSRPGKLSRFELELIRMHPETGYDFLKKVDFEPVIARMVYQHHERLDGTGYPQGLRKPDIIMEARIIAVADVVEAMVSHRPYRAALGLEEALMEIERGRGNAYDECVVDACILLFREKTYTLS